VGGTKTKLARQKVQSKLPVVSLELGRECSVEYLLPIIKYLLECSLLVNAQLYLYVMILFCNFMDSDLKELHQLKFREMLLRIIEHNDRLIIYIYMYI
jgi:hypothetical protein